VLQKVPRFICKVRERGENMREPTIFAAGIILGALLVAIVSAILEAK
jgi:hypothetical protein